MAHDGPIATAVGDILYFESATSGQMFQPILGEAVVVVRLLVEPPLLRNSENKEAPRPEDSGDLFDSDPWLGDMLENLGTENGVNSPIADRQMLGIGKNVDGGTGIRHVLEKSGGIIEADVPLDPVSKQRLIRLAPATDIH